MDNGQHVQNEEGREQAPLLFKMINRPTEQFKRLKENPKILVALLIVTGLTILGTLFMINNVNVPADDVLFEGMSAEEMKVMTLIGQVGAVLAGLFIPVISILISSVI